MKRLLTLFLSVSYAFACNLNSLNECIPSDDNAQDIVDIAQNVIVEVNDTEEFKEIAEEIEITKVNNKVKRTDNAIDEQVGEKVETVLHNIPENTGFKSYMDYRCITSVSSYQYELQNLYAYTGDYGIRMVGDRYCIAVGSYFNTSIGQIMDLILENGTVIPCIMADMKADIHTDETNIVTLHNGCVSEFVIDGEYLNKDAKYHGDISYCATAWDSPVVQIKVYNENILNK